MTFKGLTSNAGKRELVAWGILAIVFLALGVFHASAWGFVVASVAFLAYVSWTGTAYFVETHDFNKKNIAAWALPVGMAIFKVLVCLGLVWSILWVARHLFKS